MSEPKVGDVIDDVSVIPTLPLGTELSSTGAVSFLDSYRKVEGGWRIIDSDSGEPPRGGFISDGDSTTYFAAGYNEITKLPGDEPEIEAPIIIKAPRDMLTQIKVVQNGEPKEVHFEASDDGWLEKPLNYDTDTFQGCYDTDCSCGVKEDAADPVVVKEEFVPKFPNDPDDPNKETPRGDVLREAEHLITGDRNKTYGPPTENFRTIADLATTRFSHLLRPGARFKGSDVADFQIITKLARNITDTKRDNYTDMAGYAACGYECTLDES